MPPTLVKKPPIDSNVVVRARQSSRSGGETRLLDLVNPERQTRGLAALKLDPVLREVAREHSRDMVRRGFLRSDPPERACEVFRKVGLTAY